MSDFRKSFLSAVGGSNNGDDGFGGLDSATPAPDYGPLPKGSYVMVAAAGKGTPLSESRNGKAYYTITLKVLEGEYAGRCVWLNKYFTSDAIEYTRRDLAKFRITTAEDARKPFPGGRYVYKIGLTVKKLEGGTEVNEVKTIEFLREITPEADPYAPEQPKGDGQ